jgi:hypothetical protein
MEAAITERSRRGLGEDMRVSRESVLSGGLNELQ